MIMALLNHTRFNITVVVFCLKECFLKNIRERSFKPVKKNIVSQAEC